MLSALTVCSPHRSDRHTLDTPASSSNTHPLIPTMEYEPQSYLAVVYGAAQVSRLDQLSADIEPILAREHGADLPSRLAFCFGDRRRSPSCSSSS